MAAGKLSQEEIQRILDGKGKIKEVTVTITGVSPLLLHNAQTADPENEFTQALDFLKSKRAKERTLEDRQVMEDMSWWAGLYLSEPATPSDDGRSVSCPKTSRIILTQEMLFACFSAGARKMNDSKLVAAGVSIVEDVELQYEGPKDPNELVLLKRFRKRALCRVQKNRVINVRPRFIPWSATVSLRVSPDIIDVKKVLNHIKIAGVLIGLGDWRPDSPRGGPFGKFAMKVH